jgi:chromosome segregation ATPase
MVSGSTQLNPVVIDFCQQINKVIQSDASSQNKVNLITQIFQLIITKEDELILQLSGYIHGLQVQIDNLTTSTAKLQTENQEFRSTLADNKEKIHALIAQICSLAKKQRLAESGSSYIQTELDGTRSDFDKTRSELGDTKQGLENAQLEISSLEQSLTNVALLYERANRKIDELELRQTEHSATIQRLTTDHMALESRIGDAEEEIQTLTDQNRDLSITLQEKTRAYHSLYSKKVKSQAEKREVGRLKEEFVKDTLVRWAIPDWEQRLANESQQKNFFSTYFNPVSLASWLNIGDQISLAGRGRRIKQLLKGERQNSPHLTKIQALHQLLTRLGYGCLIRPEEVYIQEYINEINKNP